MAPCRLKCRESFGFQFHPRTVSAQWSGKSATAWRHCAKGPLSAAGPASEADPFRSARRVSAGLFR